MAKEKKKDLTNFPQRGDDLEISLANSKYPQADYVYIAKLKKEYPSLWGKGGNIFGNTAFKLWEAYRSGDRSQRVLKWVKKREAWFARHYGDKNIPGIIAWLKWGGYGQHGESGVKKILREAMQKIDARKKKAGLEERYQNYVIKDMGTLNQEVEYLYSKYLTDTIRHRILILKTIYEALYSGEKSNLNPLKTRLDVYEITKYIFNMYRHDFAEHKRLINYCANLLCVLFFENF